MKAFTEEYILINGIKQYFLQYPVENSSEVVLFLHGGPGSSEAHFVYKTIKQNLPYSFVYYDQRGTGKTQSKNKSNPQDISLEALIWELNT